MDPMERLQRGIEARQEELHRIRGILAKAARLQSRYSAWSKVSIIVLGALTATKGTADQLLGANATQHNTSLAIFTLLGVLTAAVSGLQAAFNYSGRSADLTMLAADCQATVVQIDSQWRKEVSGASPEAKIDAARKLLDLQDSKLAKIQQDAAKTGLNIAYEVHWEYQERAPFSA